MAKVDIREEVINNLALKMAKEIDKQLLWTTIKESHNEWFLVQIPWRTEPKGNTWNDACIWAMETFGLPGELYKTHLEEKGLEFLFKNEKDAILMSLKWL